MFVGIFQAGTPIMFLTLAFGFGAGDAAIAAIVILLVFNGRMLAEIGRRLGGGPGGPKLF